MEADPDHPLDHLLPSPPPPVEPDRDHLVGRGHQEEELAVLGARFLHLQSEAPAIESQRLHLHRPACEVEGGGQQVRAVRGLLEQEELGGVGEVPLDPDAIPHQAQVALAPEIEDVIRPAAQLAQVNGRGDGAILPVDSSQHQPAAEVGLHGQGQELRGLAGEEVQRPGGDAVGREQLGQILEAARGEGGQVVAGEHHAPREADHRGQGAHLAQGEVRLVVPLAHQDAVGVVDP